MTLLKLGLRWQDRDEASSNPALTRKAENFPSFVLSALCCHRGRARKSGLLLRTKLLAVVDPGKFLFRLDHLIRVRS